MLLLLVTLVACGDDGGPTADAATDTSTVADTGARLDAPVADAAPADTGSGGSTVGMLCANDDNCTGAGEVCCLSELPTACQLATDCEGMSPGIPCESRDDCPNEGNICCRVATDQFCTRPETCEGFGGEQVP